jgi:CubicO group peptidase (beta-lactamase class C family)
VAIIRDGKIIYSNGYGSADLEHDIPITPSTVFYLASVSKQFVTFSILLLEEQGKLKLDDQIQTYLPDFPEYTGPITISHLIYHISGIKDYFGLLELNGKSYLDHLEVNEVYEMIKSQKELDFPPGEQYQYSNSGYFLLYLIIEKVSGKSLKEFAHEHIFVPLGMNNTMFYDDINDLIKNRAFSYQKTDQGFNNLVSRFDLVGSGGMYSTVKDLALWDYNFYENKLGIGGQAIMEKMLMEGILNNGEKTGYAFALRKETYRGLKTLSHSGESVGYRTRLLRFPEQKFTVIILSNRSDANPEAKAYEIADIMLKDQLGKREGNITVLVQSI